MTTATAPLAPVSPAQSYSLRVTYQDVPPPSSRRGPWSEPAPQPLPSAPVTASAPAASGDEQRINRARLTLRYLDRYDTPLTRLKLLIEKLPNHAILGLPAGLVTLGVGAVAALNGDGSWLASAAGVPMLVAGLWGVGIETSGSGVIKGFRQYSIAAKNRAFYEDELAERA